MKLLYLSRKRHLLLWCALPVLFFVLSCQDSLPDYSKKLTAAPPLGAGSIQITKVTDRSATISWDPVAGADRYRIYIGIDPNMLTQILFGPPPDDPFPDYLVPYQQNPIISKAHTYTFDGLVSGRTHYVKISSINQENTVSAPAQVQFTTLPGDESIYINFGLSTQSGPAILNTYANFSDNRNPFIPINAGGEAINSLVTVPMGKQLIVLNGPFFPSNPPVIQPLVSQGLQSINRYTLTSNWSLPDIAATAVPAVLGNQLYVGAGSSEIALDTASGQQRWAFSTLDVIKSTPATSGSNVYFTATDGFLYCLDKSSGSLVWQTQLGSANLVSSPAIVNGMVVVGSDDGNVYALDATQGTVQWTYATQAPVLSSPLVAADQIYIGSTDGNLYCLGLNGQQVWSYKIAGQLSSSPVWHAATKSVLIADVGHFLDPGILYSLSTTGNKNWSLTLTESEYPGISVFSPPNHCAPIVSGGSNDIYICTAQGTALYRVKPDGTVTYKKQLYSFAKPLSLYPLLGSPVIYDSQNKGYYARTFASFD